MADGAVDRNPIGAQPGEEPKTGVPAVISGPDLARLKRMFEEARDLAADARTQALIDLDYYDGNQWTAAERAALRARKQPDIVINRIKPAVNGIIGVSERAKSDPRAFPRTPKDEGSADVATDVLRYIVDHCRFHRLKQDCFFDMLTPGTMAALVGVDADLQVEIVQIRWEELFADPRSRRRDYKDAKYVGIAKWMYADDLAAMYPAKATEVTNCLDSGGVMVSDSFEDRPLNGPGSWVDKRRRRLLVIEIYYREATWQRCVFVSNAILESGPSPYVDEKGRPDCPIEAQSAYVDRNNNRYGVVRDMRGPQDEVNKRRSKLVHLISVSQLEATEESSVSADTARAEAARPDGVIPYGFKKVSTADMSQGQVALLQEAKSEIERLGPNPAVLGRGDGDSSGRALLARQQAGLVELALLYGGLEDWELRIYRQCWARVKQFWKGPQYIRVTDDNEAPRFVLLNEPMQPGAQPQAGMMGHNGDPPLDLEQPQAQPQQMQPGAQPQPGAAPQQNPAEQPTPGQPGVLGFKNNIAEMDVDIVLDTTPDQGTLAQEQFNEIVRMVASNPAWAQEIGLEDIIELSAIPRKRQIIEKMKAKQEAQAPLKNKAAQLAEAAATANVAKIESETELNRAKTDKTGAEAASEIMRPHTEALSAIEAAQTYQQGAQPPTPGAPQGDMGDAPIASVTGSLPPQG